MPVRFQFPLGFPHFCFLMFASSLAVKKMSFISAIHISPCCTFVCFIFINLITLSLHNNVGNNMLYKEVAIISTTVLRRHFKLQTAFHELWLTGDHPLLLYLHFSVYQDEVIYTPQRDVSRPPLDLRTSLRHVELRPWIILRTHISGLLSDFPAETSIPCLDKNMR